MCVIGDKRVRTDVAAFDDDLRWKLLEKMTESLPLLPIVRCEANDLMTAVCTIVSANPSLIRG